ncbi:MAG: hypothetical protein CVU56_09930 [Deltaproteobacteria bacterium HGW-Deltaproteobacteria-14]|jgi:hypothetical protein|nr:MAG: hypothetical protein CVU56_09930 [Deltaproteobacteria bacterium HGW-Deltaproteobacteria-14]
MRSPHPLLASALALSLALGSLGEAGAAAPSPARPLCGVSACALLEGLPGPKDPIREQRAVAGAFRALDRARDQKAFAAAHARFERVLAPLFAEAARVFHPTGEDAEVDPKRAQRFLSRHVFGRDALLRIGDEAFEPRPELAAALALTACRAGDPDAAIAVGRGVGGADTAALRAFSALLLLEAGRRDEALELLPTLGDEGFLAPWIAAELATDADSRRALHTRAARRVVTPDQQTALREQTRRFDAAPAP